MKKKLTNLFLLALMGVTLAACGKGSTGPKGDKGDAGTNSVSKTDLGAQFRTALAGKRLYLIQSNASGGGILNAVNVTHTIEFTNGSTISGLRLNPAAGGGGAQAAQASPVVALRVAQRYFDTTTDGTLIFSVPTGVGNGPAAPAAGALTANSELNYRLALTPASESNLTNGSFSLRLIYSPNNAPAAEESVQGRYEIL